MDFERLFGKIFISLLSAVIALILLDKVSILFLNHRKSAIEQKLHIKDVRKPMPYVMFKGAPYAKAWKNYSAKAGVQDNVLNALGYPGDVPELPKPKNEYRIAVLGGSAAFMGNPPIPRLIQYQFEKNQCPNVKVYNFSVVSSVTTMELARLTHEVVRYQPDLVISYSGFNDIDEPFVADPRPGYPYNYFIHESNPILDSDIRKYPLVPLIAYGSNLMRYLFPGYFLKHFADLKSLRQDVGYGTQPWRQKIAEVYIENMVASHKIAKAFDSGFIAIFQPSLYFKDVVAKKEQEFINADRMQSSQDLRRLIVEEVAGLPHEVVFVDYSDFFDSYSEAVFTDRVHLEYRYRPEIAKGIYTEILEYFERRKDLALPAACTELPIP